MRLLVVKSMLGSAACSSSGDSWSADRILGSGGGRGGSGAEAGATGLAAVAAAAAAGAAAAVVVDDAAGVLPAAAPPPVVLLLLLLLKGRHACCCCCCRSAVCQSRGLGAAAAPVAADPAVAVADAVVAEHKPPAPRHAAAPSAAREHDDADASARAARVASSISALPAERGAAICLGCLSVARPPLFLCCCLGTWRFDS
jgi:hypothetical protein